MRSTLTAILLLLIVTPTAGAASIAYVDGGEVWVSSIDGAQKARIATPVVNGAGETEEWLAVAASDSGRIVAARNVPDRSPSYSSFRVWEPNGTSTVEGPLNAPSGWAEYEYPLGFDVTADGNHMAYGYSNTSSCCPETVAQGTYVRPVTNSSLDPIEVPGEHPTLFGSRLISHSGTVVSVQKAPGSPYGNEFMPWFDVSASGFELHRADVAANGQLAALEFGQWEGGSQTIGKIGVVATQGVEAAPTFPAGVDCLMPTSGVATDASLSMDSTRIAWTDDQGLKVAGTPMSAEDPCALTSPPVVISPTATQGAIGGADVAAFLPAPAPPPTSGPPPAGGAGPMPAVPRKKTCKKGKKLKHGKCVKKKRKQRKKPGRA
jgi:hypothetical protein